MWFNDNGRWMVATPIGFELPADRIVEVRTKGKKQKMRLATEPSKEDYDKYGNRILVWGKSDLRSTHGKRIKRGGHRKGIMK